MNAMHELLKVYNDKIKYYMILDVIDHYVIVGNYLFNWDKCNCYVRKFPIQGK